MNAVRWLFSLTPHGHLNLTPAEEGSVLAPRLGQRIQEACRQGNGHALLHLGGREAATTLPADLAYWRELAILYLTEVCTRASDRGKTGTVGPVTPVSGRLEELALAPPVMQGAEYVTVELLERLWQELERAFLADFSANGLPLQDYLKTLDPSWNLVGRVHFHLAENHKDPEFPFAFVATYTDRLATGARPQHQPLGQALRQFARPDQRDQLLSLLLPVQRAAESCRWLRSMVESGEIYHPLRWSPREARQLLQDLPALEQAGVVIRMPANWRNGRPPSLHASVAVGGRLPSMLGIEALLDFKAQLTLDGEPLTPQEIEEILAQADGLALIRGRWVEVDQARLARVLASYQRLESMADAGGLPLAEAMRMLTGADLSDDSIENPDWSRVTAGPWLAETLARLRAPQDLPPVTPGGDLQGTLRPYQQVGLRWLHLLSHLGLGACLADDMGLGKTIQVLALLLVRRQERAKSRTDGGQRHRKPVQPPSLLVAPASLLANWAAEIEVFAPSLKTVIAHASFMPPVELKAQEPTWIEGAELVITSYASLLRLPALQARTWDLVVLDEAQAIKNPGARQTRAVKKLQGRARLALTGTPIENRLGDLWSIFDFINPGLLGGRQQFSNYVGRLNRRPHNPYAPLRDLVRPYILRRLKTDRAVISDLPEKTEMRTFCHLSRKQATLYQQAVVELQTQLALKSGFERGGLILAALMRFKQICNHPSQWLGDGSWAEPDSGKWARLREIIEVIAARQEKVLVFTQFREITGPLCDYLGGIFGRPGLVLHGQTAVGKRKDLVQRFQEDEQIPFFVLSLKAGGAGLNLTAAAHVIHFDRWWNPAVENQATDRAFRIGQTRNVLVHKFVCRGTIEEKIDALISSKERLSQELLESGPQLLLTEMPDDELLDLVALDLRAALKES